jgi:hypothetical protein
MVKNNIALYKKNVPLLFKMFSINSCKILYYMRNEINKLFTCNSISFKFKRAFESQNPGFI